MLAAGANLQGLHSVVPATQALLAAGANLRGKTHMDELAYSLNGENVHYGTPVNPNAPGRIPGGSSSGSAVSGGGTQDAPRSIYTWYAKSI